MITSDRDRDCQSVRQTDRQGETFVMGLTTWSTYIGNKKTLPQLKEFEIERLSLLFCPSSSLVAGKLKKQRGKDFIAVSREDKSRGDSSTRHLVLISCVQMIQVHLCKLICSYTYEHRPATKTNHHHHLGWKQNYLARSERENILVFILGSSNPFYCCSFSSAASGSII